VIASRSFSRDLGAQLSAGVLNPSRGGLGNISTLPSATRISGTDPQGVFGGLVGTGQPLNALAAAASTVIGLTTGIFGTAQISALITAAENKGTAKVVATPRITTLNNRKAEISSGQQIPVTTGQSGGGDVLFTTTFVSVPLRLEVTPRITDVGTVILHVLAENNSVNTSIAINGTPGIDTQKMETYVLVPDGGTTIVGGVLGENESTTKIRTPGIANIPILGNLFKRKTVTKQSSEILFFITPRIYRPDYYGRPTTSVVGPRTRSNTIPQPVPLGNPQSNTTTQQPTEQEVPAPNMPTTPRP
jgi:type IV pilus assembly protein PilQ